MILRRWVTGTPPTVTHNLSELKIKDCRHHPRASVRRASGFVLTGYSSIIR